MNYWTENKNNIFVAAHRGWSSIYPENTMLAFRKALELNIDQLETDIRVTKDGELVLIHDKSVDRTTNGSGLIHDYTLKELRMLDAGSFKGEAFAGEKIPTFTEFMELVKDVPRITLDIELKEYPEEGNDELAYDTCDRVLEIIDKYDFTDRVVINTFSGKLHEYIQDKYGSKYRRHVYYPISYLRKGITRDPYVDAYCCCMFRSVYNDINMASPDEFEFMRKRGIEPWAGSAVKNADGVDRAIECGATLITCNNPDEILEYLRARGKHL